MNGGGSIIAGIIALILAAASVIVGFLNHVSHFVPLRSVWFGILFVIFLIIGLFLILRKKTGAAGSESTTSK